MFGTTTDVIGNLPNDGSPVYVRLWFRQAGSTWSFVDSIYNAPSGSSPAIASPATGVTLDSPTHTFTWSVNGTAVDEWWIYAGSTKGGSQYHDSLNLFGTTTDVIGNLPSDGTPVHVRLWYRQAGSTWSFVDSIYDSVNGESPAITSPAAGLTLGSPTSTFTWSANGATVDEWWIYAGSTQGGRQYYDSLNLFGATTDLIGNLPNDGSTVYVRLWYRQAGSTWSFIDSIYDAASSNPASLTTMALSSNGGVFYPAFDTETKNYAASCGDGDEITVSASSLNESTEIYINNTLLDSATDSLVLQGLSYNNDIVVEARTGDISDEFVIHCISQEFPQIDIITKTQDIDDGFIITTATHNFIDGRKSWLLVLDNNGVPRYRQLINGRAFDLHQHSDGRYSYGVLLPGRNEFGQREYEYVVLDSSFSEVDRVQTVDLNNTDGHDFLITPESTYMLLSYNSIYRDFTAYGLSDNELTRDSIIQEVSFDGELLFEWNSFDHVDINDCLIHRFPDDYAHINSVYVAPDGNIIASLRGCSKIFKIDRVTGDTIWSMGGMEPTLQIVGDPFREFCGQHSVTEDEFGNVYIFDNGGPCNGSRETEFGQFSRALQYKVNIESSTAIFVRDYSPDNSYTEYAFASGSLQPSYSGNWLISWGHMVDVGVTEVTPNGDVALQFEMRFDDEVWDPYRAYRIRDFSFPVNPPD